MVIQICLCGESEISTKPVFIDGERSTSSELTVLSCRSSEHDNMITEDTEVRVNEPQKDRDFNLFVLHESVLDQWQARCDILKAKAIHRNSQRGMEGLFYEHLRISAPWIMLSLTAPGRYL